jgi:hypothetical protein
MSNTNKNMHPIVKDILNKIKTINEIIIYEDKNCDMTIIKLNGMMVYEGNTWDYHNGCYGIKEFKFTDADSFIEGLMDFVYKTRSDEIVFTTEYKKYDYVLGKYED